MDINEQILNSINILIKSALQQANFDQTIKAIIIRKNGDREYKCNYQGTIISATSLNDNEYNINDSVYILIPAFGKNGVSEKIILGKI